MEKLELALSKDEFWNERLSGMHRHRQSFAYTVGEVSDEILEEVKCEREWQSLRKIMVFAEDLKDEAGLYQDTRQILSCDEEYEIGLRYFAYSCIRLAWLKVDTKEKLLRNVALQDYRRTEYMLG